MSYIFRQAKIEDASFISKVIIESEKSGSNIIGLAKVFDLTEPELKKYLIQMLEEEIEGCELSFNSFIIVELNNIPVAGFGGWIENENEDNQPSFILKSNLLNFILPQEKITYFKNNQNVIKDILVEREPHTHQVEYAFVEEDHRGNNLTIKMLNELTKLAKNKNSNLKKTQAQFFENNTIAIEMFKQIGYKIIKRKESNHTSILNYLPYNVKLILEKEI